MELKEVEIDGVKVFQCFGHGACTCKKCAETNPWNTHWTDWCSSDVNKKEGELLREIFEYGK